MMTAFATDSDQTQSSESLEANRLREQARELLMRAAALDGKMGVVIDGAGAMLDLRLLRLPLIKYRDQLLSGDSRLGQAQALVDALDEIERVHAEAAARLNANTHSRPRMAMGA